MIGLVINADLQEMIQNQQWDDWRQARWPGPCSQLSPLANKEDGLDITDRMAESSMQSDDFLLMIPPFTRR